MNNVEVKQEEARAKDDQIFLGPGYLAGWRSSETQFPLIFYVTLSNDLQTQNSPVQRRCFLECRIMEHVRYCSTHFSNMQVSSRKNCDTLFLATFVDPFIYGNCG